MEMKVVSRDKNFSVLIQVAEIVNLKKQTFILTHFVLSLHFLQNTDWLGKTYRQYAQIVIQLVLHFEQGYVGVGVVQAVDVNSLNLDRVASIPDPAKNVIHEHPYKNNLLIPVCCFKGSVTRIDKYVCILLLVKLF